MTALVNVNERIAQIFEANRLEDLNEFLNKRKCLNSTNVALAYLFHIFQSAGILMAAVATGYSLGEYAWIGALLNSLATLIYAFEKYNESLLKQYAQDIRLIHDNNYLDEAPTQIEEGKAAPQEAS